MIGRLDFADINRDLDIRNRIKAHMRHRKSKMNFVSIFKLNDRNNFRDRYVRRRANESARQRENARVVVACVGCA